MLNVILIAFNTKISVPCNISCIRKLYKVIYYNYVVIHIYDIGKSL